MKPGGNYTSPNYDPITEEMKYDVYVHWIKTGSYDSDAEATYELHKALENDKHIDVGEIRADH